MTWLLAGIIPPVLSALVNHTDKYLLLKTKHKSSVNVLMVYSTLFSLVILPFLLYFSWSHLFLNWTQVGVQVAGGIFLTLSIYFYLIALNKDEASVVMPFAMLVPVFGFVLSYFILGEVLSATQVISCVLIIAGAAILSFEFNEERKIKIKHGVLVSMIVCTVFQAAQETLFKWVTIENSFAVSVFWSHIGITACGLFLILTKKGLLNEFLESVTVNGKTIFGVNFISEFVSSIAYTVQNYAGLIAPIAIVMTLNGYQPVFVFIFGIIMTILLPKFVTEKIKLKHLLHKGIAIGVILIGTILISQTL